MRLTATFALAALLFARPAAAQAPAWTRVGGLGVEAGLAGPAGSPVSQAAFSLDASALVVRTAAGRRWRSFDRGET